MLHPECNSSNSPQLRHRRRRNTLGCLQCRHTSLLPACGWSPVHTGHRTVLALIGCLPSSPAVCLRRAAYIAHQDARTLRLPEVPQFPQTHFCSAPAACSAWVLRRSCRLEASCILSSACCSCERTTRSSAPSCLASATLAAAVLFPSAATAEAAACSTDPVAGPAPAAACPGDCGTEVASAVAAWSAAAASSPLLSGDCGSRLAAEVADDARDCMLTAPLTGEF